MAGYSGTPLLRKLGIKEGYSLLLVHQPENYLRLLGELPEGIEIVGLDYSKPIDFIHLFAENEDVLRHHLPKLKEKLSRQGMLWVSWIKGSSKLKTDINGNEVRSFGLDQGLVDIKVCAFDENWSGLKFVFRKEDR